MFSVNGTTITLSRGDTGAIRIRALTTRKDTGEKYDFGPNDRAVFSIKNGAGELVREKYCELGYYDDPDAAEPEWIPTNSFVVVFYNADTQNLNGNYSWDVRFVINPYYEDPETKKKIVDGDQVITPNTPMSINLLTVVGEI